MKEEEEEKGVLETQNKTNSFIFIKKNLYENTNGN